MGKLIALALATGLFLLLLKRDPPPPAPAAAPPVDAAPMKPAVITPAPASVPAFASPVQVLPFNSAKNTMASQLELLTRGDVAGFRASFSVPVSDEQFALCQKRMSNAHLSPDWEMAKHSVQNGQRVTKVSIFGKGMTTFREVGGRYVADAVWCVPLW
jgi:hypothetical protein